MFPHNFTRIEKIGVICRRHRRCAAAVAPKLHNFSGRGRRGTKGTIGDGEKFDDEDDQPPPSPEGNPCSPCSSGRVVGSSAPAEVILLLLPLFRADPIAHLSKSESPPSARFAEVHPHSFHIFILVVGRRRTKKVKGRKIDDEEQEGGGHRHGAVAATQHTQSFKFS